MSGTSSTKLKHHHSPPRKLNFLRWSFEPFRSEIDVKSCHARSSAWVGWSVASSMSPNKNSENKSGAPKPTPTFFPKLHPASPTISTFSKFSLQEISISYEVVSH